MTLEELLKLLEEKDPKGKEALAEYVESALTKVKEKNNDLIATNKRFKKEAKEAKEALEAKEEELEEAIDAANDKKGKETDPKVDREAQKQIKTLTKERDELKEANGDLSGRLNGLIIDNNLSEAITSSGIAKQYIPAVKALIKTENKIEIDDTENVAKIGDKAIGEFLTEWSQSDIGKNYVAAKDNSGGGGKGGEGTLAGMSQEDIMKLPPTKRLSMARAAQGDKK